MTATTALEAPGAAQCPPVPSNAPTGLLGALPGQRAPEPGPPAAPRRPLTERELEVQYRVSLGHSNEKIARDLRLSLHTVKSHLAHAFDRLGVPNRASLVGEGFRLGLLEPRPLHPSVVVPPLKANLAELLPLMALGMTDAGMGVVLDRSPDAVKTRIRKLMAALGAHGRDEAVRLGVEAGYLVLGSDGSWGFECDPRRARWIADQRREV